MHLPGTCLNHYRIVRQLGAGGMGEVYEAEDTRLKRRIALKVLPPETSTDPLRRARFQQEAEAVAALNHPNIVTIHSIEDAGNIPFLTMEIVDGCTLDRLVPAEGLPLQDLLKYAIAIVDALSAAHERGIVHRDLKPANVMVANDGRIKVLDFGIARLLNAAAADASAPTSTGSAGITAFGAFAGTPAYMSPEQAEGRPADHRSDIFSVGVLLYEMATGVRPFSGDTNLSILSSIVRDEPVPMSAVRKGIPRPFERIVADCLAKDPSKRLTSAKLLRARLEALAADGGARSGTRRIAGATLAVVLAAGAFYIARHSTTRADVNPGVPAFARVTYEPGIKMSPSLSPDGRDVAYAFQPSSKPPHIVVRRLDHSVAPIDLSRGSSGSDDTPVFSPDGRSIAFASTRDNSAGIFIMDRDGGNARRLINGAFDPSWTPDGSELVYSTESGQDPDGREAPSELWIVNVSTGQKRRLARIDAVDPAVSPDGRFVAFWGLPVNASGDQFADANRDVWVQPMAGGAPVRITDSDSSDWNPAWSSDSRFLYFSSDRSGAMNIWRVPVDAATGRPAGAPIAITAPSSYVSQMTVGRDGTVAYTAFDFDTSVRAIAFDPVTGGVEGAARDVVTGHRSWLQPDVSPDGRLVALRSFRGQEDVWVVGADGTGLRPVTHDPARDRGARWAPDGSLLFYSSRNHGYQFWTVQADGSGARQLTNGDWALNYPLPSPDGRRVAATNPNSNEQLIFDARDWSRAPERLPVSPGRGQTYLRDWSPDGTRLAAADVSSTLWVFDLAARTWDRVGTGSYPRWLPDGERMLAVSRGRITLLDTRTKTARDIYGEPGRYIGSLALTADGRQLYFTSAITQADIWTMRFAR